MTLDRSVPSIQLFEERLRAHADQPMLWHANVWHTYGSVLERDREWTERLAELGVGAGSVCVYVGDYWPEVVAFLLALIDRRAIGVPVAPAAISELPRRIDIARPSHVFHFAPDDRWRVEEHPASPPHPLVAQLRDADRPGAVVFTSGSTGEPKGILHDYERVLSKFVRTRRPYRTLLFLLPDHVGGLNTLFSALSSGGAGVVAQDRGVGAVLDAVARARAELLPTSPSFLRLALASGALGEADLSSVRLVTYGTEPMAEDTLRRVAALCPNAAFKQTYGLSELGVLPSSSQNSVSLAMRMGGDGFETKVVDDTLWIRSASAMVGYLNAPSPFDADGWMNTGDVVVRDGDYLRIRGRRSQVINVGGEKVFPAEVEAALLTAERVVDATVVGEQHPALGMVVVAHVQLAEPEGAAELRTRLRAHCRRTLAPHKVPVRFVLADEPMVTDRFKKHRPTP